VQDQASKPELMVMAAFSKLNKGKIAGVVAMILFFLLDRVLKYWATQNIVQGAIPLLGDFFTFSFHLNPHIAFSLPLRGEWLTLSIGIIFLLLVFYLLQAVKKRSYYHFIALLALTLGAGSNLIDRILVGGVIDYLDIKYITIFNIADMMIIGGVSGLLFLLIYNKK
jgi:signal peptidase II